MNKNIPHTKSDKRVTLSFWQTLGHYSFMLVPLMIPALEIYYKLIGKTAVNSFSIITNLIFVVLSLIIGYLKWQELAYYQLNEKRTDEEFENAVFASANRLKWKITNLKNNVVEAIAFNRWKNRDPQKITIKREENSILINSMIEPGFLSVPDFLGINKKNRSTFLHYYQYSNKLKDLNEKVVNRLKDEEGQFENEPEWGFKNTFKRIIAYLFSLAFLSLAIAIYKFDGFIPVVPILGLIGSIYIILDVFLLIKKWKASS